MIEEIIGGTLIAVAAVSLYIGLGRIAGISGICANILSDKTQAVWQICFVLGLGLGGWLASALVNKPIYLKSFQSLSHSFSSLSSSQWGVFLLAGLFVGVGTRLGSGCTSGHGVCGMARFSLRSLAATCVFLAVGMLVASGIAML